MKIRISLIAPILLLILASCDPAPKQLTEEERLDQLINQDYLECAHYYCMNEKKDPWLKNAYHEYIVPVLAEGDFLTLWQVMPILNGTPAATMLSEIYQTKRDIYYNDVCAELDQINTEAKESFRSEIIPLIELSLDSIMELQVHEAVEHYSGGFMNFRKLGLLVTSDNMGSLFKCCKEYMNTLHFDACALDFTSDFLQTVNEVQTSYYTNLSGYGVEMPRTKALVSFGIPDQRVFYNSIATLKKLNEDEMNDLLFDVLKAGADIGVGVMTGGTAIIYEVASGIYDAYDMYQEFTSNDLEFNEVLELTLSDIFNEQVSEGLDKLNSKVSTCLDVNTEHVKKLIKEAL